MTPIPIPTEMQSKPGTGCDLAFALPTAFDITSFLIFNVLPIIIFAILVIIFLFKKNKKLFLKKLLLSPILIIAVMAYIFFYPRNYLEYRSFDGEVTKRCECLGIKSEVLGGNQYCSYEQKCLGIPYSCKTAVDQCIVENEGEVTINKIKSNDPEPFTEEKALELVKEANAPVQVVKFTEIQMPKGHPYLKRITITYKVDKQYERQFYDTVIYLPLDREAILSNERKICAKTGLDY